LVKPVTSVAAVISELDFKIKSLRLMSVFFIVRDYTKNKLSNKNAFMIILSLASSLKEEPMHLLIVHVKGLRIWKLIQLIPSS
jgi:hypothetical protein